MAKASLKLSGNHDAWAPGVRSGILTRADGSEQPVFVRPLTAFGPEAVEPLREEARLIARINVRGVLRVEYGTTLQGKPAMVHQAAPVASLMLIRSQLRERGLTLPVRTAVQIAAELAHTLNDLLASSGSGVRYAHPGFGDEDVLIDVNGGVYLAGIRALRDNAFGMQPVPGTVPPTSAARTDAATYAVGVLLFQMLAEAPFHPPPGGGPNHDEFVKKALLKVRARAGDAPSEDVLTILRKMLGADPALRGGVGAAATRLEQIGAADRGVSLAAWAPAFVSTVGSVIPAAPRPAPKRANPEPAAAPTFAEDDGTHRLRPVVTEADETMRLRASEPEPVFGLPPPPPDRVKAAPASAPMMMDEPKRPVRTPPSGPELGPGPSIAPGPSVGPVRAPSGPALGPSVGPRPADPRPEAVEPTQRMPQAPPAIAPKAAAPRPPKLDISIAAEAPEIAPARRSPGPGPGVIGTIVAAVAVGGIAVLVVLFFAWRMLSTNTPGAVETQALPTATEAPLPMPEGTEAAAPAEAAPAEAAPVAGTKASAPGPAPAEAKPVASKAEPAPSVDKPTPTAAATDEAAEPEDDTPARIVASGKPAEPAAAPAPAPAAPAPAVASAGPYRVEFRSGDPSIAELEVRCSGGGGSGTSVVVPSTPAGTCRVKGTGGESAIVTQVSVSADRSYTCFAGGSRTCR